ncbi:MAG: EamA family transporter [Verrucomicrobia bacterium]|nr:EamA family transporter [Verrucomicrobiota bacterium]
MSISHLLLALLLILVWSFNFVAIREALNGLSPIFLTAARFFLTSIPAIFFIKPPKTSFKMLISYGLVMYGLQFALLFMGMYAGVAPGLASLLLQVHVFFSILLAILFFQEKLHLWQAIGALCSFGGIAWIGMHVGGSLTLGGVILVLGSAAAWGTGNILSKKIGQVNMLSLVIWGSLVAWPPLLILSLCVEGPAEIVQNLSHLSWTSLGSVLYIAYLSTLFGFGIWSWMLHRHPVSKVAPFTLAVPVFALFFSALLLHEPIQAWKITGGVLVIGGLCINLLGPRLFSRFK